MQPTVSIFWFRRDLRLDDNAGLCNALRSQNPVLPVFIFDTNILDQLDEKRDRRVHFIHNALVALQQQLVALKSSLHILYGRPVDCFAKLLAHYSISAVYTNHDYEPYATKRDQDVAGLLKTHYIPFHTFKDQVVFDRNEVMKSDNTPYTVFTPYSRKWKETLSDFAQQSYPTQKHFSNFFKQPEIPVPSLEVLGFKDAGVINAAAGLNKAVAAHYERTRDIPGIDGTTRLSVHLRFGTMSIRKLVTQVRSVNETLLNELIWREFYQMILWHYPRVVNTSFRPEYDNIKWRNNEQEFERWCQGQTGYPIVDAGMRELNETGYMHNRVRMITASFLTKHLLTDWRWGEAYFAEKLCDYDLAANNGNWQWAAGSGCDAAPYFRIFNPYIQTKKFDPEFKYIKRWVPEYDQISYTAPIVAHEAARDRCLRAYKSALAAK